MNRLQRLDFKKKSDRIKLLVDEFCQERGARMQFFSGDHASECFAAGIVGKTRSKMFIFSVDDLKGDGHLRELEKLLVEINAPPGQALN